MPLLHDGLKLLLVKYLVTAMRQLTTMSFSILSPGAYPAYVLGMNLSLCPLVESQNGEHWREMDTTSRFSSWDVKTYKGSTEKPDRETLGLGQRVDVDTANSTLCFHLPQGSTLRREDGLKNPPRQQDESMIKSRQEGNNDAQSICEA